MSQANPSWGAKRERGALACGAADNSSTAHTTDRDWANLGNGPAGLLIAELALANDVADYIRFRAVCHPWRRCSPGPPGGGGGLDDRFFPRRWMMLDKALAGSRCRRFLNLSTGETIRMDLPELDEYRLLALTPEGLLLVLHRETLVVRLLNPLTRQLAELPPLTTLLEQEPPEGFANTVRVRGVGLVPGASTVAVCFPRELVVAKPGDERWTVVDRWLGVRSALAFKGRLYCALDVGSGAMSAGDPPTRIRVMVLNTSSDQQPPLLQVAELSRLSYRDKWDNLHLVDNGGELMLLHRMQRPVNTGGQRDCYEQRYEIYRVDLDNNILNSVDCFHFNGRAIFMGRCRAISISPKTFPSVTADTIYLGFDCDGKRERGKRERRNRDEFLVPCFVDCLRYCIQGMGTELA